MNSRCSKKCWRPGFAALTAAVLLAAPAAAANQGDPLKLGLTNTINLSTSLSGNTPAPQLFVSNTNTGANGAIKGQSSSAAANAFSIYGLLTSTAPAGTSAAVRGENKGTNANGYGVWGSHAGGGVGIYGTAATGIAVYGKHTAGGTGAGVRGDSASGAASAFALYGLLTPANPGTDSAAVRGENKGTNANGYGVWGSHAGSGTGVYGTSVAGTGVYGTTSSSGSARAGVVGTSSNPYSAGVRGENKTDGYGVYGVASGAHSIGVQGDGDLYGVEAFGFNAGVLGWGDSSGGVGTKGTGDVGVYGSCRTYFLASSGVGVRGDCDLATSPAPSPAKGVFGSSFNGTGVRGESANFQGVSGSSQHNAGVYGETTADGFAGYFVGPTEQHGNLNTYNAQIRVAHGGGALSGTSAALQAEQEGTSGEAGWLRVADPANTSAVLMLIKQSSGSGDFLKCYEQSGPGTYTQRCHVNKDGTFVSGSDFAESLHARGGKASYSPGDVLVASESQPGDVERARMAFDRKLIGVYSTRPAVLGAEKGDGVTRVGQNDVPVAITGIVPVKAAAENGSIRPGDLLTSSSVPGRAMNAGLNPRIGTVLGKALGVLQHGNGTIRMLVMLR